MIEPITMKQNPHFSGIEVKLGEDQYSRYSHIHQTWSFSYVLKGKTNVTLGTKTLELYENLFITVPPGIPHLCSPDADNHFRFAVLYLPSGLLNVNSPEFTQPRVGRLDSVHAFALINQFLQMSDQKELEISSEDLKEILDQHSSPLAEDWGASLLDKEMISVRDFSQGSRFQQYRYTRKHFGISQKKISTIERMELAKELMTEGLDLVEIALTCGFYDQSHFSKVFKLYTGLTPAHYMKK